jgi:hypothetical protein
LNRTQASAARTIEFQSDAARSLESIQVARDVAAQLETTNRDMKEKLSQQIQVVGQLTERAQKQEDLISHLLPAAASAGLASAFALRVRQVERTKWIWLSVGGLALTALNVLQDVAPAGAQVWWQLLHRLPIAGPLIWLGWFSAIQYGNVVRLQEDYAFKEATSKAFAGIEIISNISRPLRSLKLGVR